MGESCVQLGAVGEEVGVLVLVAGSADERGMLESHFLGPVELRPSGR